MTESLASLPKNHYRTLLCDPPWRFRTWSERNQRKSALCHYDLMTLDDIKAMPLTDVAAPDCALFLWVSNPMLPDALEVMVAWGFTYKTVAFTWAKASRASSPTWAPVWHLGLGYWTRANTEMCLLGTRGKPQRRAKDVRQLLVSPVREHSRKPDETYDRIERLVDGPYLELFARTTREGWDSFGLEVGKFKAAS